MSDILQFPSQVESIRTLKDGSIKVDIETQELPPEDMTKLFEFKNKPIWIAFKETDIKYEDLDIKEPAPEFKTDKSPSQRLRSVLYRYWEQKYSTAYTNFDDFYKKTVDQICKQYKDKLD